METKTGTEQDAAANAPQSGHPPSLFYRLALVLGALSALGPLAIDMYLPSFPAISRDFGTTPAAVQGTLAFYFIGLASGQVFYGPVSDRFGRKPPLYFGLALFTLAALGCAMATNIETLMIGRLLQALGGGAAMVIARAVVRDHFGERDSVRLLSMLMLVMGLAPILAPLLGGQLVSVSGWRSIFLLQALSSALLLFVGVRRFLPESLPPERRQSHTAASILRIYAGLFRNRLFMADTLVSSLMTGAMFSYISGSPFVFMEVYKVTPQHYGLFFGSNALGLIAASQLTGRLVARYPTRDVLRVVLLIAATSSVLLLAAAVTGFAGFAGILLPLFCMVSCQGLTSPLTAALALSPQGRNAGTASALLGMVPFLAGAGGGALVGAFYDGSAVPMALVMAVCGVGACAVHLLFGRKPMAAAPA